MPYCEGPTRFIANFVSPWRSAAVAPPSATRRSSSIKSPDVAERASTSISSASAAAVSPSPVTLSTGTTGCPVRDPLGGDVDDDRRAGRREGRRGFLEAGWGVDDDESLVD